MPRDAIFSRTVCSCVPAFDVPREFAFFRRTAAGAPNGGMMGGGAHRLPLLGGAPALAHEMALHIQRLENLKNKALVVVVDIPHALHRAPGLGWTCADPAATPTRSIA